MRGEASDSDERASDSEEGGVIGKRRRDCEEVAFCIDGRVILPFVSGLWGVLIVAGHLEIGDGCANLDLV